MVMLIDIDHVQIAAPPGCEAKARQFFSGLLGLVELEKPKTLSGRGGCWFKVGTRQLHVGIDENFTPATKAHPAFSVEDVATLFSNLQKAGVECQWDDAIADVKRLYATDPWGNRLEFAEHLRPA